MQSDDYVPGVSGWKLDLNTGKFELNDGNRRVTANNVMVTTAGPGLTNDQAAESVRAAIAEEVSARSKADERAAAQLGATGYSLPKPFVIVDGVTYIRKDHVDKSSAKTITPIADTVREVLREELRPGGLLYRSNR